MSQQKHAQMHSKSKHPFFDAMPGHWSGYVCTLREFENKCCDLDKCEIVNEYFITSLLQTSASDFEIMFIYQLLMYYRARILTLTHKAGNTKDEEHVCILLSRKSLYASQSGILNRELISRKNAQDLACRTDATAGPPAT